MVENPVAPVPAQGSRARTWWIAGAVAVALILAGAGAWFVTADHGQARPFLPATLLGFSKYTGPGAQAHANAVENQLRNNQGGDGNPISAFYGDSAGGFNVAASTPCPQGGCTSTSGKQLAQVLSANGPDARAFPAGPGGLALACVSGSDKGVPIIECAWISEIALGAVTYQGNLTDGLSLAGAAAKTRQIRAAVER